MSNSQDKKKPGGKSSAMSRRNFIKGLGVTSVGVVATPGVEFLSTLRQNPPLAQGKLLGPDAVTITLEINGKKLQTSVEPRMTLADVLRDQLHLTGTKIGCDRGACGACTIIMAGKTVSSCMTLALDAIGQSIETIEGLSPAEKLHEIQESFIEHDGLQCGFCTSGMIMSCKNLLDSNPNPSLQQVKVATSGNLCRCGTYPKVFDAVLAAGRDGH